MVEGDIFPDLVTSLAGPLSHPLANIFNDCLTNAYWPRNWKMESVTIIPKISKPESFNNLRNISCTPLFSKTLEFFVLDRLKSEACPAENQYGGIKGSSTSHYLVRAWNAILEALDSGNCAVNLISVDFTKAFNTMSHTACLQKLYDHTASHQSMNMIHAFLSGRKMKIKTKKGFSTTRSLPGGSPQGTLLGNFLYIMTMDDIELRRQNVVIPNIRPAPVVTPPEMYHQCDLPSAAQLPVDTDTDGNTSSDSSFIYFSSSDDSSPADESFGDCDDFHQITPDNDCFNTLKFVDDLMGIEPLQRFGPPTSRLALRARTSESFFKSVAKNAEMIGMSVNPTKTQMLSISGSSNIKVDTFINPDAEDPDLILGSGDELKILGFYFGSRPNAAMHVRNLKRKFWARAWVLPPLKKGWSPTL